MQRIRLWPVFLFIAQALLSFSAKGELRMAMLVAGTNTYSNAVITASSKDRVLVDHGKGMVAVRVADLNLETQQQLASAGLVQPELSKQIAKQVTKREAAKRKAARASSSPASELTIENAQKTSLVNLLGQQLGYQADTNGVEFTLEGLENRFGRMTLGLAFAALLLAGLFRRLLFYRLCKIASGESSFLVFIPVVRWIALADAASMGKQWLLVPVFAFVAFFLPPPAVQSYPWIATVYLGLVALLWFVTIILYFIWCVRICQSVNRNVAWALLFALPLLDYIGLIVLAFSEGKPATSSKETIDPLKNAVLAI